MKKVFFLLCLVGLAIHETKTETESPTYEAAVIEFLVDERVETDLQRFQRNTEEYGRLLLLASEKAKDILVFPESTLNNEHTAIVVPQPHERIIPCGNRTYNPNLQDLSCHVQRIRRYVVVNLVTQRNCSVEAAENDDNRPCRADDLNLYNTNVVFDRNGMVISLYRKFNLDSDEGLNRTLVPDVSTFVTDFDVTFGHLAGFDILFESPAKELLQLNVTDFVYPVRMQSEIPFLTALQIQEGWAIAHNVNFLAAGANQPSQGGSGSGIYSGDFGALKSFVTGVANWTILDSLVPKIPGHQLEDSIRDPVIGLLLPDLQLTNNPVPIEIHRFINSANTTMQEFELCDDSPVNRLCCNFQIQVVQRGADEPAPTPIQYSYAAVAFNGYRSIGDTEECFVRICAVLACTNNNVNTCGTVRPTIPAVESHFSFTTINIRATGAATETDLIMPNTLITNLLPLTRNSYSYANGPVANSWDFSTAHMNLTARRHDVLTFGMYIRDFTYSSAVKPTVSLMTLIVTLVTYFK